MKSGILLPMKSTRQERAERAAARFRAHARAPIVIEFAGLPKAGKTTTLSQIQSFLKRCGFRTEVVVERASVCPIRDKRNFNFNVWTACTTLAQILEKTQSPPRPDDPDILILDRGLFDAICWLGMMEKLARLRPIDRGKIEEFVLLSDWRRRITGVILMTAKPEDALKRERGVLPIEGAEGSIMNKDVLQNMHQMLLEAQERFKDEFRIVAVNTSRPELSTVQKTCEHVCDKVLDLIEEQLSERILNISAETAAKYFSGKSFLSSSEAVAFVENFEKNGEFTERDTVEADASRVQALPIVVVRNKRGDVLRLRRREKRDDNPLHEKLVIWAGGHVRSEDNVQGEPIKNGSVRELHEELRLAIDKTSLRLMGAIHSKMSPGTTKHAAIVYEWRAETDDVAVVLSSAEFFERRGTALSGTFVPVNELVSSYRKGELGEEWSGQIVEKLLVDNSHEFQQTLL